MPQINWYKTHLGYEAMINNLYCRVFKSQGRWIAQTEKDQAISFFKESAMEWCEEQAKKVKAELTTMTLINHTTG